MRIEIEAATALLTAENAELDLQMTSAQEQERIMSNTSCENLGLSGAAYQAIEERINMRALVVRTHYQAYEAIKDANTKNVELISALPFSLTNGVLDTDECDQEIEKLQGLIREVLQNRSYLCGLLSRLPEESFTSTSKDVYMNNIYNNTQSVIDAHEEAINMWVEKRQAAYDYNTASSSLYGDAKAFASSILAQATSLVDGCIQNGSYDAQAYEKLTASMRLAEMKPYLTDEEYAAISAALSNDGIITAEELYRSGDFHEDLYLALLKLPSHLVTEGDVGAVAGAYNFMVIDDNTQAIERFYELAYYWPYENQSMVKNADPNYPGILPPPLYFQYSLLGRVADAVVASMASYDTSSEHYYKLIGAASLLASVANDPNPIYASGGLSVTFELTPSERGEAYFCALDMGSADNIRMLETLVDANGVPQNFSRHATYCSVSGQPGDVYALLLERMTSDYIGDGVNIPAEMFVSVLQCFLPIQADLPFSLITALESGMSQLELEKFLEDNNLAWTGVEAAGYPCLTELGFTINTRADAMTFTPADTSPQVKVYMPDSVRGTFETALENYRNQTPDCRMGIDGFIENLESNMYGSVVSGDKVMNTSAYGFLEWSDMDAELEYKENEYHGGVLVHEAGDTGPTNIKNYSFAEGCNNGDYSNYQYKTSRD